MKKNVIKSLMILILGVFVFSCSVLPKDLRIPEGLDFTYDPVELVIGEDKTEFKVLVLSDTQMRYYSDGYLKPTFDLIDALVEHGDPDLIVLNGDNTEGANGREILAKYLPFLDSLGVPYAPTFGNHDPEATDKLAAEEGVDSSEMLAELYKEYGKGKDDKGNPLNLIKIGPDNIHGVTNYVINLIPSEDAKNDIKYSIYMIDSNRYRHYTAMDKAMSYWKAAGHYDYIYPDQIAWYKYNVLETNAQAGKKIDSLAFFHIALPEHRAYHLASEEDILRKQIGSSEPECNPWINTGMFDVMRDLESTKAVLVGHDHTNNYVFKYQDIILGFGMKTGRGSYYDDDYIGGTFITLRGTDFKEIVVEHITEKTLGIKYE